MVQPARDRLYHFGESMIISAVLLSGGIGTRFGASSPKQYLLLQELPIALHSFSRFIKSSLIDELIVVCEPSYENLFKEKTSKNIGFALPGPRRQDSLLNALQKISSKTTHVLIHDAARPFISDAMLERVIHAGLTEGAAALAMPVKATVKEANGLGFVTKTPDRSTLYEIQTPQIVRKDLLQRGFQKAEDEKLTVTDDVSFAEILGAPVKLVEGSYFNIKITTIEDLYLANSLITHFQ